MELTTVSVSNAALDQGKKEGAVQKVPTKKQAVPKGLLRSYVIHADGSVSYSGVQSYTVEQYIINTIKQFTRNDFQTHAPRDYLYCLNVDQFTFGLARSMMADQAKNVGFNGFATMCRNYESTLETPHSSAENITNFTGQPLILVCGKWFASDNGIFYLDRNGEPFLQDRTALLCE